jgi:anthranilate phosphoribosyltransferase
LRRILTGDPQQNLAYRDAVLINTAGALIVAGEVDSWRSGVEEAREAIDKGLANTMLNCWIKYCE